MCLSDECKQALGLVATLTIHENQILAGLVGGQSMGSIAASLSIPLHEATHAKQVLMEKLSARTTADVVRIGIYASASCPH